MDKAIRLFYALNVNYLTSSATFHAAADASMVAAADRGFTVAERNSVADAWDAVGVLNGGAPGNPDDIVLTNNVPVTTLSGASNGQRYFKIDVPAGRTLAFRLSGGTGDADLYVRLGSRPTTSTFLCRPYINGNNETCQIPNTVAGDYYIMLRGYTTYSGVTLQGSF